MRYIFRSLKEKMNLAALLFHFVSVVGVFFFSSLALLWLNYLSVYNIQLNETYNTVAFYLRKQLSGHEIISR
jgi:hypothetical protein